MALGGCTSGGVEALADSVARRGYYGGVRLLLAATKRFVDACRAAGAVIKPELGDFALSYETNIPRQTGLSGSSALIVACQACLFARFGLDPDAVLRKPLRPELVLSAERELGITAGLQDRVIQTYGGLVSDGVYPRTSKCLRAPSWRITQAPPLTPDSNQSL